MLRGGIGGGDETVHWKLVMMRMSMAAKTKVTAE